MTTIPRLDWPGLYNDGWRNEIVPESFSHPAKYPRALIRRIYEYMIEQRWLQTGDRVLDPFGGVGLGAVDATRFGLQWTGLELEPDFAILAHRNFATIAEREWCTCGPEGESYLRAMRESLRERTRRGQPETQSKNGSVLQHSVQQQLSLQGMFIQRGTTCENDGANSVEQRTPVVTSDERKTFGIGKRRKPSARKERELERRKVFQKRRIHNDTCKRKVQDGTRLHYGAGPGKTNFAGRNRSSQEWQQTGQSNRKPRGNDDSGTHEDASSIRDTTDDGGKDVRDLQPEVQGTTQRAYVQRAMQATKAARIRTQIRRQTEGQFCATCGKLIVFFPIELQGDSRDLARLIAEADSLVSSPPYSTNTVHDHGIDASKLTGNAPGRNSQALTMTGYSQADGVVSSPPYTGKDQEGHTVERDERRLIALGREDLLERLRTEFRGSKTYGASPGQLGSLQPGDFSAAISSPPYAEARIDGNGDEGASALRNPDGSYLRGPEGWAARKQLGPRYGTDAANLGNLPADGYDSAIGSPPFEDREASHAARKYADPEKVAKDMARKYQDGTFRGHAASEEAILRSLKRADEQTYGTSDGNIGNAAGDTFWNAARTIVEQCYAILRPGAYAAFVTGDFVRNKQRVPFGEQWLALCEAVGFEPVLWAVAWKTEHHGTQLGLLGEDRELRTDKTSFFRRLANKNNPDAAIRNEDVLFVRKPEVLHDRR